MRDKPIVDLAFMFGPFRLIPSQQILLNGDRPVKLGGRALDILHLLVRRAGEEISKGAASTGTAVQFACLAAAEKLLQAA